MSGCPKRIFVRSESECDRLQALTIFRKLARVDTQILRRIVWCRQE